MLLICPGKTTSGDIRLLEKGPTLYQRCVPTLEKVDKWQVEKELERLGWEIRLKMHYLDKPTPAFSETPSFKVPSSWTPLICCTQLEMYLSELEEEILKIDKAGQNYAYLFKAKRQALPDLMYDKNNVIKSADNGSAFVICDKQVYLKEFQLQLGNKSGYEKMKRDQLQGVTQKTPNVLLDFLKEKEIDKKLLNYLLVKNP